MLCSTNHLKQHIMAAPAIQCCICYDSTFHHKSISCSSNEHHLCIDCLAGYVQAEAETAKQRIAANNDMFSCPGIDCKNVFEHHQLAQRLPAEPFSKLLAAWRACIEQAAARTGAEAAAAQSALAGSQSEFARARAHILDALLTLKCPRCSKAFLDFEACFALRCSDSGGHGCGTAFCGYCLEDCGDLRTAHRHVGSCEHNSAPGKALFSTKEQFDRVQVLRRVRTVQAYLNSLPLQLRAAVQDSVARELRDCGIALGGKEGKLLPQLRPRQQQPQQQQAGTPQARAAAAAADNTERAVARARAARMRIRKRNVFVAFVVAAVCAASVLNTLAPDDITPVYVKVVKGASQ
jgi:hypothetical protein